MSVRRYGFKGTATGTLGRMGLPDAHGDVLPLLRVLRDAEPLIGPDLGWQDQASCAETDPEIFFPEKGGSAREARQVCQGCEVRAECLEYALTTGQTWGIWGGMSEMERRALRRDRTQTPLEEAAA